MTKAIATRYNVKDLAEKVGETPKKTRVFLRQLAASTESTRFQHESKSYEWNGKDFAIVARQVSKLIEAQETECSADCTGSISEKCVCHCGGANHGIHASH